jgi:hypothetical protein
MLARCLEHLHEACHHRAPHVQTIPLDALIVYMALPMPPVQSSDSQHSSSVPATRY